MFKVFFWIVCNSQSTLKSPQRSKSTQISESPFLQLSQHYLYLLYRSARRAGGGNTEGWVEGQSIGWGRKSTRIYCASVCIYVHTCLITVIVLERRSIFIWEALMSLTASYLFCLVVYYHPCTHTKKRNCPTCNSQHWLKLDESIIPYDTYFPSAETLKICLSLDCGFTYVPESTIDLQYSGDVIACLFHMNRFIMSVTWLFLE